MNYLKELREKLVEIILLTYKFEEDIKVKIKIIDYELKNKFTILTLIIDKILSMKKENQLSNNKIKNYKKILDQELGITKKLTREILLLGEKIYKEQFSEEKIEINVFDIIESVIEEYKSFSDSKKIKIEFISNFTETYYVLGWFSPIYDVIRNLISNAIKYSFEETTIKVKLLKTGKDLQIDVENKGIIIDEKDKENIFKEKITLSEFLSKNDIREIGLFLCKTIINKLNGDILLVKSDESSTLFRIILPLATVNEQTC